MSTPHNSAAPGAFAKTVLMPGDPLRSQFIAETFLENLKVIIETCMLTDAEKIEMCRVVSQSGAEYIKTSTGFGGGGATREDVALFKANVAPHVKIKAAGGIANLDDARDFIALGADRLGTSRIVKAVKAMEQK